jgi:hypothetical protein
MTVAMNHESFEEVKTMSDLYFKIVGDVKKMGFEGIIKFEDVETLEIFEG